MATNGSITQTTFTNADDFKNDKKIIFKQVHLDELSTAIANLKKISDNVDNCGYINCCESCQDKCTNCTSSCQGCQSCQNSCTCQSSSCQKDCRQCVTRDCTNCSCGDSDSN